MRVPSGETRVQRVPKHSGLIIIKSPPVRGALAVIGLSGGAGLRRKLTNMWEARVP